jgi:pyruvate,water dikinase
MLTPVLVALYEFESFCSENLRAAGVTAHDLLSGLDNKTAQMTRELAALGEKYRSDPDLTEPVQDFLSRYGARCEGLELMLRSWSEDEGALMALVLVYSLSVSEADDEERLSAAVRARSEAVERAHDFVRDKGEMANAFEAKLAAAECAAVLSEDHAFEIDYPLRLAVRRAFCEAGNRLARVGAIDRPEDVFMLRLDELCAALLKSERADLPGLVLARRSEMARWKRVIAPVKIGDGSSSDDDDDRISQAYAGYLGLGGDHGREGTRIMGKAASPGRVTGTARVLRKLEEISRLTPGDILVVSTTSPTWTPVFRAVSGVVTDIGGTLSHAAIVARELGIPAVVATRVATEVVVDGQRIEVDGSSGHVRLL